MKKKGSFRSHHKCKINDQILSEAEAEVDDPTDKEVDENCKRVKLDHSTYDYVSLRHLPTVESELGSCLPAEADAEVSKMI